jgi:hypothetical protein
MEKEKLRFEIYWEGFVIEVLYSPDWLACYLEGNHYALAHMEIRSVHPERAALPMTETGYRSHFEVPDNVDAAGGPEAFVRAWLAEAARSPEWRTRQAEQSQLSLFGETGPA